MAELRPSREVYMRIRWDARFDETRVVIGYEERGRGIVEVPFAQFVPDGPVPWHRVWHFRAEEMLWDRREKLDRVFGSGAGGADCRAVAPRPDQPVEATSLAITRAGARRARVGPRLRVVTFNVLFDLYDADRVYTDARTPVMLDLLRHCDADLIALQEVTPRFFAALLDQAWVTARYDVSEAPPRHGVVLLSRVPLTRVLRLDRDHRLLAADLDLGDQSLRVAAVHLSSDRAEHPRQQRAAELATARRALADATDALVLGDFNMHGDDELRPLARDGFADVWSVLHPGDPGLTFDPETNSLAELATRSGRRRRLDRVMLRSSGAGLTARRMHRLGTGTFGEGRFVSDHYGLAVELAIHAPIQTGAPTHHTAVVVIPADEEWEPIQSIRREHDRQLERWMPHINLLYGFVPEDEFPAAARALTRAVEAVPAFDVELARFRTFDHQGSSTIWLEPTTEPPGALHALHHALFSAFPRCHEQSRKSSAGFCPHLSVGQLRGDARSRQPRLLSELQAGWRPLRFRVEAIAVIARRGDSPFAVRHEIALASTPDRRAALLGLGLIESREQRRKRRSIAEGWTARLESIVGEPCEVTGSTRLGASLPDSDIDLVCAGAVEWVDLERQLARLPEVDDLRLVDARSRVVQFRADSFRIELQTDLDTTRHADALLGRAPAAFAERLEEIRAWARRRAIDSKSLGYIGGLGWAVLVARATRDGAEALDDVLAWLRAWGADDLPCLLDSADPGAAAKSRDHMIIGTPCAPWDNLTPNVTRSTLDVLRHELLRTSDSSELEQLVAPATLEDYPFAVVADARDREAIGWLQSRLIGLVIDLEHAGLEVRPMPEPGEPSRFVVGCRGDGDPEAAMQRFEAEIESSAAAADVHCR